MTTTRDARYRRHHQQPSVESLQDLGGVNLICRISKQYENMRQSLYVLASSAIHSISNK